MAWIKYIASYKHGYGQPEWLDVGPSSPEQIEDFFIEHDHEHGDPEGFRRGRYEVFDAPPLDVLECKIKSVTHAIAGNQAYLLTLQALREKACSTT